MFLQTICPSCHEVYELTDQQRGHKVRCPECDVVFAPEVEEVAEEGDARRGTTTGRPERGKRRKRGVRPRRLRESTGPSRVPLLIVVGLCVLSLLVVGTALLVYALRAG